MNRIVELWTSLRASLWFVPGLMLLSSIVLALLLIELDTRVDREWLTSYPRLFGLGADGSRGMLTAIASSMLTVAALAFSLTLNAITQASGQFTPRIFRNFLRDRANQFTLGYFVSVFAYCLIVLRTIRGGDEVKFVPSLGVFAGLLLALGGIIVLIFFIHHIAESLQITTILDNIVVETRNAIHSLFPSPNDVVDEPERRPADAEEWSPVPSLSAGYIQSVDIGGLSKLAEETGVRFRMERTIGEFAGRASTLVSFANYRNSELALDSKTIKRVNARFGIARHRTIEQDVGFGIRQIVDIALKALSPGVNDTTTAINCIDFLGEILSELAERPLQLQVSREEAQNVLVRSADFEDYLQTAFDQIRLAARGNPAVFERLLSTLSFIAPFAKHESRRKALSRHVDLIAEFAEETLATDYEKAKVSRRATEAAGILRSLE